MRGAGVFADVEMEAVQAFWDRSPCNIRHSPQPVGTRAYFDEVEARKYRVEPHIPRFAEFPRWRNRRVLEIGCGIGTDTVNFARHGAQVTAVDLSPVSVQVAAQRMDVYGVSQAVRFQVADAERLTASVPPEPYDLIYLFGVLHHTPHPDQLLEQLAAYRRPGTTLKLMVYHRYAAKVWWILWAFGGGRFWDLDRIVARHSEARTGCPVTYTFSRRSIRTLLQRHGWRVDELWVDHIFSYRIADYVQYRYVKPWHLRWIPPAAFHWLERRLGWHLCVTATAV